MVADMKSKTNLDELLQELDELGTVLSDLSSQDQQGFDLWHHRMNKVISEVVGPNSALAIKFNGLMWGERSTSVARQRLNSFGGTLSSTGNASSAIFITAKRTSAEIISTLIWEVNHSQNNGISLDDGNIDVELWEYVSALFESQEWDKVALNAAVFVEDKLRTWANISSDVKGSTEVFKMAVGQGKLQLGDNQSEQQGWQQLAVGFALALRNPSGHRIKEREDVKKYAFGVLGIASLLLTEIRHVHGNPPKLF